MGISLPVLVGFFPKMTERKPDWLKNKIVQEICSVSACISKGPDHWIEQWKHNELGFYDSEVLARSIVQKNSQSFDLYAYKMYPVKFKMGQVDSFEIPPHLTAKLFSYEFLGYDPVSRSAGSFFECSSLSCNHGADDFAVNQYCLIPQLEDAYQACIEMSQGRYEPGPYYLLEVYLEKARMTQCENV